MLAMVIGVGFARLESCTVKDPGRPAGGFVDQVIRHCEPRMVNDVRPTELSALTFTTLCHSGNAVAGGVTDVTEGDAVTGRGSGAADVTDG